MKAIITDAGFASRYLPITKTIPKAMIPIGSKPVMQLCVEECREAGIDEIIIVATPNTMGRQIYDDYFHIDGIRQQRYQLVQDVDGNFYFISDGNKIVKNIRLYLGDNYVNGKVLPDGRAIVPGYYQFDAEGKLVVEPMKNGLIDDYLYINDVKQTRYKFVEYDGNFYFVNDGDKVAKNTRLYLSDTFVNGKVLPDGRAVLPGYYQFDAEGKMVVEPIKNGVVGDYLYINDVKQTRYKLVEYDGNFYFINDGDKVAKNTRLYLGANFVTGTPISAGYYRFDDNGKLIIE